jgi:hypothetical protein
VLIGAISATAGDYGQVLNLSRDLVAKGIAAPNMTPDTAGLDSRPLFQAGVAYASANHIPTVVADPGSYYFLSLTSPYQHVYLNAPENLTVDLQHSDLYFVQGNIIAIDIANSVNLTLKNFTVDYQNLPFTELTVTGVSSSIPPTLSFTPIKGYPLPSSFNSLTVPSSYNNDGYYVYVFRSGRQLTALFSSPAPSLGLKRLNSTRSSRATRWCSSGGRESELFFPAIRPASRCKTCPSTRPDSSASSSF